MARSIEKVIEDTIREMYTLYDSTFDYEFEEALRDQDRFLDWDEQDADEEYDDEWDEELIHENLWPIYGNLCSQKKMNRGILALVPPNPQGKQKERSHGRLEKCKK